MTKSPIILWRVYSFQLTEHRWFQISAMTSRLSKIRLSKEKYQLGWQLIQYRGNQNVRNSVLAMLPEGGRNAKRLVGGQTSVRMTIIYCWARRLRWSSGRNYWRVEKTQKYLNTWAEIGRQKTLGLAPQEKGVTVGIKCRKVQHLRHVNFGLSQTYAMLVAECLSITKRPSKLFFSITQSAPASSSVLRQIHTWQGNLLFNCSSFVRIR